MHKIYKNVKYNKILLYNLNYNYIFKSIFKCIKICYVYLLKCVSKIKNKKMEKNRTIN